MRGINEIIVHCSATTPTMDIGVKEIRDWHVHERRWSDVGYHFIIRRDGRVDDGRPVSKIGAHARGHNEESIGVCLVGGLGASGKPDANFTIDQYISLRNLVGHLKSEYPDIIAVTGHRDYNKMKACPCFDVESLF
jgi:N-acetyl-anhydromuramyl-L-alanine amidase AmpD